MDTFNKWIIIQIFPFKYICPCLRFCISCHFNFNNYQMGPSILLQCSLKEINKTPFLNLHLDILLSFPALILNLSLDERSGIFKVRLINGNSITNNKINDIQGPNQIVSKFQYKLNNDCLSLDMWLSVVNFQNSFHSCI